MKKFVIISGFLFSAICLFGQEHLDMPKIIVRGDPGPSYTAYPDVFIKINSNQIKLDSSTIKLIDPNWIKKIEVIKSEKYKELYGNYDGTVMIYPKKKYKKYILDRLKIPK